MLDLLKQAQYYSFKHTVSGHTIEPYLQPFSESYLHPDYSAHLLCELCMLHKST